MDRYRFLIGLCRCTILLDGTRPWPQPSRRFFANAPEQELANVLRGHNLDLETWTEYVSPCPALLVEAGVYRALIDAGAGPMAPDTGNLIANLNRAGVHPENIDAVILTHAHDNHLGGAVNGDGQPAFPRARYYIARSEWDFWTGDPDLSGLTIPDEEKRPLIQRTQERLRALEGQIVFVEGEEEIRPGLRAIPAPGHTPGHMAVELVSEGQLLLHIGDAALHPIGLEHPAWRAAVDMDAGQAEMSLRMLMQRAQEEHALVFGSHFCFPCLGHVSPSADGWQWQPGEVRLAA